MTWRRGLVVALGVVISVGALYLVSRSMDPGAAMDVLAQASPVPLLAILGVVAVQVVLRAWRWSILVPADDEGRRVPPARLLPPLLVGYLGNAVLPARLGEPMRAVLVGRRERVGTTEVLGSVLVERVVDVATLAPVAFIAALLVGAPTWTTQVLGVAAVLGIGGLIFLATIGVEPIMGLADRLGLRKRPRASALAHRFISTLGGPSQRRALLAAAGISGVAWLLEATSFWLAAQSVGADLDYAGAMLVAGIAVLGTAIPSAPGYVGTFELAAAGMATALGVPGAEALAMAVVVHVMTLVPLALGGAASLVFMGANLGEVARAAKADRE